eukprot:gene20627-27626_t
MGDADDGMKLDAPGSASALSKLETFKYVGSALLAMPLGFALICCKTRQQKQYLMLVGGFLLAYVIMVPFYFLCVCAANLALYFVIKHAPDSVSPQGITFAVSMLIMLVYRLSDVFFDGLPEKDGPTGAAMMMWAYRINSVAFDVRGSALTAGRGADATLVPAKPMPPLLDYFAYMLHFGGICIGPVLQYGHH